MVSAYGGNGGQDGSGAGKEAAMTARAEVVGLSYEELEAKRAEGLTFLEILEEKGVDREDFQESMAGLREERMQERVDSGYITQEQMQERLEKMESRGDGTCDGSAEGQGQRGGRGSHKGGGMNK